MARKKVELTEEIKSGRKTTKRVCILLITEICNLERQQKNM